MQIEDFRKYKLPDESGVYIFRDARGKPLYIGKAASLHNRVRSYFASDLAEGRGSRIVGMVAQAQSLSYQKTDSVLEALILEANLIKRHQPPYNVDEKDNKSFNYLVLTKESFPHVLVVRGRELYQEWKDSEIKHLFGPFPQGESLKEALKIVRKIFPYADKCVPCAEQSTRFNLVYKVEPCKPCFNRQIGLCPGVCTGEISKKEYARTIQHIRQLFSGNFQGLKRGLAREMKAAATLERFEDATKLRRQIHALEHIRDVSLIKEENRVSSGGGVRIEAYDVAHTSGSETVAVMTVVHSGEAMKAEYRKFKIRSATNDDIAALKEVLSRRLNHSEWPLPRVFVVDGGLGQMRAAERILESVGISIPVVGVVKNEFHKPERLIGDKHTIEAYEKDMVLANAEAHRFVVRWHQQRRDRIY